MTLRAQGNEYRTTLVCVDDRRNGTFRGRLYNPYWKEGVSFSGVMEVLTKMEELLDQMQLPQSFTAKRSFVGPQAEQGAVSQLPSGAQQGEEATFYIRVLFRQNASWQGTVRWAEANQEEPFRSVLELLMLMDSAAPKGQLQAPSLQRRGGRGKKTG